MICSLRGLRAATAALCCVAAPLGAHALPVLSEVFYDAIGVDDGLSFVELYGAPGTDLSGMLIQGINGTGGTLTDDITLSGVIPADGLFVIADGLADGTTQVANADLIANFDFQNGPDSVVLFSGEVALDAVGYGVFAVTDVFAGEGSSRGRPRCGHGDRARVRGHRYGRQRDRFHRGRAHARQRRVLERAGAQCRGAALVRSVRARMAGRKRHPL